MAVLGGEEESCAVTSLIVLNSKLPMRHRA